MDLFASMMTGFSVALQPMNLLYCIVGVTLGTLIGVLPGLGPATAIALLLPVTYGLAPATGIILLAGIYYGSMYGGSTTSILVNIPGEAASIVTCIDGHKMAQQGRAGPALGMAAIGSFIAGTVSIIVMSVISAPLAKAAVSFGPAEYFSLMVLGLTMIGCLTSKSLSKALIMVAFGITLGLVGIDSMTGLPRLTFDKPELVDGIGVVTLIIGLFGVSEILVNVEGGIRHTLAQSKVANLLPNRDDWHRSAAPIARGSALGFLLGLLPGGGGVIASFISYALEKRVSREPERFGHGAIEGVAGPESANNAAATSSFIPLLTLGIPANVIMGLLLGALMLQGVQPGPLLMVQHAQVFWGAIASMYVGNVLLLILNLPLIGIWVRLLKVPYGILYPVILMFCVLGVYGTSGKVFDLYLMAFFGLLAYALGKLGYDMTPLVLGFILGPLLEFNLRRALITSDGDWSFFITRPISAACLALAAIMVFAWALPGFNRWRRAVPVDG